MCHFIKELFSTWVLLFVATNAFVQTPDTNQRQFDKQFGSVSPLLIQYDHGGCFVSHSQQIIVEDLNSDSLLITMKRLLPVAYRHYKYNERKRKYEAQDSIQIANPFTFTYPKMGDKDYFMSKEEYLPESSFKISRSKFTNFLNEFMYLADKGELQIGGIDIEGLYSNIQLIHNNVIKQYSFKGSYQFDIKIQMLQ